MRTILQDNVHVEDEATRSTENMEEDWTEMARTAEEGFFFATTLSSSASIDILW